MNCIQIIANIQDRFKHLEESETNGSLVARFYLIESKKIRTGKTYLLKTLCFWLFVFVFSLEVYSITNDTIKIQVDSVSLNSDIDSLIQYAATHLGKKYCRGGSGKCFDCSGFVQHVFATKAIHLPRSSAGIAMVGEKVERDEIRVGDVVYFKGSNYKSKHVGHVGIVVQIDGDDIIFIHASIHRGICFDHVQSSYYQKRFLGARRFLGR